MSDIRFPTCTWEETRASDHWPRCTHPMDNVLLVKDAEQAAVFWDAAKNVFHYSVRYRDWFVCQVLNEHQAQEMFDNPAIELQFLRSQVNFLKSLYED